MTPAQFCVWLSGFASAKPGTLDPKIQTELDTIIADMVAHKLSGVNAEEDFERMKNEFEARKVKTELDLMKQMHVTKQAPYPLSGGIIYSTDKPQIVSKAV